MGCVNIPYVFDIVSNDCMSAPKLQCPAFILKATWPHFLLRVCLLAACDHRSAIMLRSQSTEEHNSGVYSHR